MDKSHLTIQDIKDSLSTVWIEEDGVDQNLLKESYEELNNYRISHAKRFLRSLELIRQWVPPERPLRILEVGSAPYFFTVLLAQYFDCEIVGVNIPATVWPGQEVDVSVPREVVMRHQQDDQTLRFPIHIFNVEKDPFPFDSHTFDLVLSMEVIEHLAYSPTHMLAESHRVLKPGGRLLLSTPNAVDMRRTLLMLLNRPCGFHYSGYSVYGRHNREFTLPELSCFVENCGYKVLDSHLENIFLRPHYSWQKRFPFTLLNLLSGLPLPYLRNKREYMFIVAEATGAPIWAYPENLYIYPHLYKHL
ncbi:MAG: class I SAM-dependent methyltransferase [Anaerolineae bacterium]|nr:class I SAM-dependent methyltransferase [Anaerolineae bacterium]